MAKRQRHTPGPIISKPREAEVKTAEGTALARVCKDLGDHRADVLPPAHGVRRPGARPGQAARAARGRGRPAQAAPGRRRAGRGDPQGGRRGKIPSPARRREAVEHVRERARPGPRVAAPGVPGPGAGRAPRGGGAPPVPDDEPRPAGRMVEPAGRYGRYGYRRVAAPPRAEGLAVDRKRVERLWRREGPKVPQRQPRRGRLWLNDGSCVRPRPERKDRVWSHDLVQARTRDGRAFRRLTDRRVRAGRAGDRRGPRPTGDDMPERLTDLLVRRGVPGQIRSDDGPGSTAKAVRGWLGRVGVGTPFIGPGSPWEDGYVEPFNGELLGRAAGRGGVRHAAWRRRS